MTIFIGTGGVDARGRHGIGDGEVENGITVVTAQDITLDLLNAPKTTIASLTEEEENVDTM